MHRMSKIDLWMCLPQVSSTKALERLFRGLLSKWRKKKRKMFFNSKKVDPTIAKVSEITGWPAKKAEEQMDKAKGFGLSYKQYLKYEAWTLSDAEIAELVEKIRKRKEAKEDAITTVCEKTGWGREAAAEALKEAAACGLSRKQYISRAAYDLSKEDLPILAETLATAELRKTQRRQFYLDIVCRKTGWDAEKARTEIDRFRAMGISSLKYVQNSLWELEGRRLDLALKEIVDRKSTTAENKENYRNEIMAITGWNGAKTDLEVLKCRNNCGSSYEDFLVFKLYECTPEQQRQYVTLDMFIRMRLTYNEHSIAKKYFDDKAKFNETFAPYIHRRWFVNMDLTFDEFTAKTAGMSDFLVKPLAKTQGIGIHKLHLSDDPEQRRSAYEALIQEEKSIIEEYITQHEAVAAFCPASVNTLRITTLYKDGECHFLYSVFRMGRGAVVDNFHAGGIAASVDPATGVVLTDAADLSSNTFAVHPTSGLTIKGFQIPHWDQVLDTCRKAAPIVNGTQLVGWDFAITPDGVDLIEGNPGASYVVAQIPNVSIRKGLRSCMVDPYLELPY